MSITSDPKYIERFKRNLKRYQKQLETMRKDGQDTQQLENLIIKAKKIIENPKDEK